MSKPWGSRKGLAYAYWRKESREEGEARAKIRRAGKAAVSRMPRAIKRDEVKGAGLTERELRRRGFR